MESTAAGEGPAGRGMRRWGLVLLLLASVLPYHGCRAHPGQFDGRPVSGDDYAPSHTGLNGAAMIEGAVRSLLGENGFSVQNALIPCDGKSDDFLGPMVFLALPFWIAALLLVRGDRPRTRWTVGALLGLAMAALVIWAMFAAEWPVQVGVIVLGSLLLVRPRHRRRIPDVEATVSSQAQAGLGLCLAVPLIQGWVWTVDDGHSPLPVLRALGTNYRAGFWLALAALALVAAPLHFSEETLRRLYDRCRPWRPRSSTPTPTSTSTGSTPTGTPSSTAPAGPGSSPS